MSHKDYQIIAVTIRDMPYGTEQGSENSKPEVQRRRTAEAFAEALAVTNPALNRELFIQAATGVVAVNARKPIGR